jgi:hypothetical protein
MEYLLEGQLAPGMKSWMDYFDIVIASAQKPKFFLHNQPFRKLDKGTGRINWEKVTRFDSGEVYVQGCVTVLLLLDFIFPCPTTNTLKGTHSHFRLEERLDPLFW